MRINKVFITALLAVLATSCYSPNRECKEFQTGTFEFETYLNGKVNKTRFTRNDTLEIDYYQGKADSSSIRWINDCEYIARKINPQGYSERKALQFKILSTDQDSYTFEYSIVGETNKQKGEAIKISEETVQ